MKTVFVKYVRYYGEFVFSPPLEGEAAINANDIQTVVPIPGPDGEDPLVLVTFRNGNQMKCVGQIESFQ